MHLSSSYYYWGVLCAVPNCSYSEYFSFLRVVTLNMRWPDASAGASLHSLGISFFIQVNITVISHCAIKSVGVSSITTFLVCCYSNLFIKFITGCGMLSINNDLTCTILGYLQPFPPSNSPQTYYLLYFITSLQKIPPSITPLQPFPTYLFPLYTITH